MRCPYCHSPLTETAQECPGCRLNLSRAAALLGPVPRLESGISDHVRTLSDKSRARLQKRIKAIEQRFPQITLQIICHCFPLEHPFPLYLFWIFNMGGIASASQKAGDNHTILLALDPVSGNSGIMVGYGLEPFLGEPALDHLLEVAEPAWIDQSWAEGIGIVLDGLDQLLESAIKEIGNTFDLPTTLTEGKPKEF